MRRLVILVLLAGTAHADPEAADQGIGADIGIAGGGTITPGGLRIAGHYLYQLSDRDWFDGSAAFTFGGGGAECFRDRTNRFVCTHGLADGKGVEIAANVRRYFRAQGDFHPFALVGAGVALVDFSADGVSGLAIPLHAGGGVRAEVSSSIAVVVRAEVAFGVGAFGHGLGIEPQLGAAVLAGAEFRLP